MSKALKVKAFYKVLRALGFKRDKFVSTKDIVVYSRKGNPNLEVQVSLAHADGRVCRPVADTGRYFPTSFSTVEGLHNAIEFEIKRSKPKSRIPRQRYYNGDTGCKKGWTWTQMAKFQGLL